MKRFARTGFAAAGLSLAVSAFAGGYGAKHIVCGWDIGRATPDIILKHADRFDRLAIDGIALYVDAEQDGERLDGGWIMNNPAWRYETFAPLVPTYRKIVAHRSLRESFLCCGMSARKPESGRKGRPEGGAPRIGLDDDAAWTRIAGNYRVLAKLAKAGGLRGLLFDNEDYHGLHQFTLEDGDGGWESACAKMRARGRQVFRGIFEEYPDVRLLFFWAFSNGRSQSMQSDPLAALRESKRLFPAFLNGMLDVIPPTAVFIDGDEDSYVFRAADGAFENNAVQILSGVLPYVAPENRAKYRAQVRNSYGLYLDQYVGSKYRIRAGKRGQPNNWYRPPVNGSRDAGFREDLEAATRCADEYVWIYGERFSFIDWGTDLDKRTEKWNAIKTRETWNERIGLDTKLRLVRDPDAFLREELARLRADPKADNLYSRVKANRFPSITALMTAEQITNRNTFAVTVELKDAKTAPMFRWRRGFDWNWNPHGERKVELKPEGPAKDGWTTYSALVRVPEGADNCELQMDKDIALRNAGLYRLDAPPKRPYQLAYQLDVARNKIPTIPTLKRIADIISSLGYTQFQLYMECSFAYKGHEEVWKGTSPLTAEEVRELADYCRTKGVELVPSQNSFAHMGPWFRTEAYRKRLAECPNGIDVNKPKFKKKRGPVTLVASGAASLEFLGDLYDQLLPNFGGRYFNIGCDEVYDLLDDNCRSAARIAKDGYARVYFDHVLAVRTLAYMRQRDAMFWADAIFEYPELIKDILPDMVALVYGYDAGGHDKFDRKCAQLADAEVRFFVCPGTSGWAGPSGRVNNMMGNVKEAFEAGRKYGAEGMMVCDWGDGGHHQPWIVALPSLVYAAGLVQGKDLTRDEIAAKIDAICGAKVGRALLRYGDVWEKTPDQRFLWRCYTTKQTEVASDEALAVWHEAKGLADFTGAPDWVKEDFTLMDLLYRIIEAKAKGKTPDAEKVREAFRQLWLKQNREGGSVVSSKILQMTNH